MNVSERSTQGQSGAGRPGPACAALAAGCVLLALDAAGLLAAGGPWALVAVAGAAVGFAAALVALTVQLALWATGLLGPGRWIRSLGGAALALVVIIPVSVLLFRGTGISTRWYAPYGPLVVAPLLFVLTALGLRLAGHAARWADAHAARRAALALPALAAAALLTWADWRLYPNQYGYLHWSLLLCTVAALMAALWLLLPRPRRLRRLCPALLVATLPAVILAALATPSSNRARQLLAERTHAAGRLVAVARTLLDRDGDGHSIIFGEHDCDNGNAQIHPFAADRPGDGVDQDCDGRDAVPPPPRPADPAGLDVAAYRARLAGWRERPPLAGPLSRTRQLSWVLIVLDALRQDQLRPTADNRANHPRLLALAAQSRSFRRAFSLGAGTDVGMAAVLTGMIDPFAPGNATLFSLFRAAGYRTHGVFQREVDRWLGRQLSVRGLATRKLVVNDPLRRDVGSQATSRQVTDQGIRFLERHGDERFLLWLHYFDIHEHHQVDPRTLDDPSARDVPRGRPFYRRMVRHVDGQLGRFLDALEQRGLARRTAVVLIADHGEGLAETPRLPEFHGDVLYDQLIHVPLLFRVPGVSGAALEVPASLIDLLPTMADLAGVPHPRTDGVSLAPYVLGVHLDELRGFSRPLFLIEAKQKGVILWPWKLLSRLDQGLVELYQLEQDPAEEHNLVDERPARARELSALLGAQPLITIDRLKKRVTRAAPR